VAAEPEERGTKCGDDELAKSAAEKHDGVAGPGKAEVAGFVDHEVGQIEEQEGGGVAPGIDEKEEVEDQAKGAAEARDARPVVEVEVHEKRLAIAVFGRRRIAMSR
jgi:hypothetical protein